MSTVKNKAWFENSRPHLEWMNWSTELDAEKYTNKLIERAIAINSDTLIFDWESGGRAVYPSNFAPMDDHVNGVDLFGMLLEKAHAAKLKFGAAFLGMNGNTYLSDTFPEWVCKKPDGTPYEKWHGYNFHTLCPSSPLGNYIPLVLGEILEKYEIDSVYIEGFYIADCHCDFCKHAFRKFYDREIPKHTQTADKEYTTFMQDKITNIYRKMKEKIDEKSPDIPFYGSIYAADRTDAASAGVYMDAVGTECQWGYHSMYPTWAPSENIDYELRLLSAISRKPTIATQWMSKHVDLDYSQRDETHFILSCMQILFNGSILQLHTQNGWENETKLMSATRECYDIAEKLRPYMIEHTRVADVAILYWPDIRDLAHQNPAAFKGMIRILNDSHIQFEVITPHDIKNGILKKFQLLLLNDAASIENEILEKIEEYVSSGGNLFFAGRSGYFDENWNLRSECILDKMAGIKKRWLPAAVSETKFPKHIYYKLDPEFFENESGRLLSFRGIDDNITSYLEPELDEDMSSVGDIIDFDYSRMHKEHIAISGYPGKKLCSAGTYKKYGLGEVMFLSISLDAAVLRYEDPQHIEVLSEAINHLTKKMSIKSQNAQGLQIQTFRNRKGIVILILNCNTNQLTTALYDTVSQFIMLSLISMSMY